MLSSKEGSVTYTMIAWVTTGGAAPATAVVYATAHVPEMNTAARQVASRKTVAREDVFLHLSSAKSQYLTKKTS